MVGKDTSFSPPSQCGRGRASLAFCAPSPGTGDEWSSHHHQPPLTRDLEVHSSSLSSAKNPRREKGMRVEEVMGGRRWKQSFSQGQWSYFKTRDSSAKGNGGPFPELPSPRHSLGSSRQSKRKRCPVQSPAVWFKALLCPSQCGALGMAYELLFHQQSGASSPSYST